MIIQITPAYKPAYIYGGPTVSVGILCEELAAENVNIKVLTTTANGKQEINVATRQPILINQVPVYYFKRLIKGQTHFSFQLLNQLYKELDKKNVVIHIHSWWNATAVLSCLLSMIRKKTVVLSPRGMLTPYSFKNRQVILKWLIHKTIGKKLIGYCKIHVTSEKEKQDLLKIQAHDNITVIANLMDTLPMKTKATKNEMRFGTRLRLLFLSRIEEKKGIELLFQALADLQVPWSLTICGSGNKRYIDKLKNISSKLKIDKHITWKGFIENTDKYKIMHGHDLLVLFSKNENFANVVLESLYAGTPVCISKEVGLSNFIMGNNLGWVTNLTKSSIIDKLTAAHGDYDKRKFISKNAPLIVHQHFQANTLIPQYIDLYHRQ